MGNTFRHMAGGVDAVEGVFGDGGVSTLCRPSSRWRRHERGVPRLRHFPQDRLKDLQALQGGGKPTATKEDYSIMRQRSRPSSQSNFLTSSNQTRLPLSGGRPNTVRGRPNTPFWASFAAPTAASLSAGSTNATSSTR